jgi:two-component system chemotaxis response regulator CheY
MSHPTVLNVGQCGFDHGKIARHLEQAFGATVLEASTFAEAIASLRRQRFALILVNRVNDSDGAPGLDLIRTLKSDPDLASLPVMLVSNYADAQNQAEALGALPGFGKSDLASPTTRARLEALLGPPRHTAPGRSRPSEREVGR